MKRRVSFSVGALIALGLLAQGCGSSTNPNPTTNPTTGGLTCSATGTLVNGNPNLPNLPVQVGGITIQIGNDSTGPFTIQVQGLAVMNTPVPSFFDPNIETLITGTSGGIAAPVSVTDTTTGATGSCTLSLGSGTGGGNIQITPANPTASVGQYSGVTIQASSSSGGTSFTFQPVLPSEPITIVQLSPTSAYVSSSTAGTYAIIVTMNGYGQSTQVNVTFSGSGTTTGTTTGSTTGYVGGTTGYTGGGEIVINDPLGLQGPRGEFLSLYCSAPGMINPSFSFYIVRQNGQVSASANGSTLLITSYGTDTPIVEIVAYDQSTGQQTYTEVQLSFY